MVKKNFLTTTTAVAVLLATLAPSLSVNAYTVEKGDTLSKIAEKNNTTVEELCRLNGIENKNAIWAGETLKVSKDDTTLVSRLNGGIGSRLVGKATANIPISLSNALYKEFDAKWYASKYPDVVKVYGDSKDALFAHFTRHGIWEGRQMNEDFNVSVYASAYKDLREAFKSQGDSEKLLSFYTHYIEFGKQENRTITTFGKAAEAGIEVVSVSTQGNRTVGTVISTPPSSSETIEDGDDIILEPEPKPEDVIPVLKLANNEIKSAFDTWANALTSFAIANGIEVPAYTGTTDSEYITYVKNVLAAAIDNAVISGDLADEYANINSAFSNAMNKIAMNMFSGKYSDYNKYTDALHNYQKTHPVPSEIIDQAAYDAALAIWESNKKELSDFTYIGLIQDDITYVADPNATLASLLEEFEAGKADFTVTVAPVVVENPGDERPEEPALVEEAAAPGVEPTLVENPGDERPEEPALVEEAAAPGVEPTLVENPGDERPEEPAFMDVVADPGVEPTVVADPGTRPEEPAFMDVVAAPGAAPAVVADPGTRPEEPAFMDVVADPGAAPVDAGHTDMPETAVADPGTFTLVEPILSVSEPAVVADPGAEPTAVSEPGAADVDPGAEPQLSDFTDDAEYPASGLSAQDKYDAAHATWVSNTTLHDQWTAYNNYLSQKSTWDAAVVDYNAYIAALGEYNAAYATYSVEHAAWASEKADFDLAKAAYDEYEAAVAAATAHESDHATWVSAHADWVLATAEYEAYQEYLTAVNACAAWDLAKADYDQYVSDKAAWDAAVAEYEAYQEYLTAVNACAAWDLAKADYDQYVSDKAAWDAAVAEYEAYQDYLVAKAAFDNYDTAKAAYDQYVSDKAAWDAAVAEYEAYQDYLVAKAAFDNYDTAKAAYDQYVADKAAYDESVAAYEAYQDYLVAKAAYDNYDTAKAAYDQYVADLAEYEAYQEYLESVPTIDSLAQAEFATEQEALDAYREWVAANPEPDSSDFYTQEYLDWEADMYETIRLEDYLGVYAMMIFFGSHS